MLQGIKKKEKDLASYLVGLDNIMVAFSGGTDSTYLLHMAHKSCPGRVAAVTLDAGIQSRADIEQAQKTVQHYPGVHHYVLTEEFLLNNEQFTANTPQRCYICKKAMLEKIKEKAGENGEFVLVDGANADDVGDYRPGMQAAREMGVVSPLKEAGLTKEEIRYLARKEGVPGWDKPSSPCLCSRIPYGSQITVEKLGQIEKGEKALHELGFKEVRLRHHGELARIEVPGFEMVKIFSQNLAQVIVEEIKKAGFSYVALDLEGFRSGSMNEVLE